MDRPYTSGDWVVKPGQEEAFIGEWTAFTEWSLENAAGALSFALIRQADDPSHFVSFGAWQDHDSVAAWRSAPEFAERLGRCRALCDHFEAHDYTLAASVDATSKGGSTNG